uniref:Uncharacterized protein n=1 Tax=Aegilops tauschii subsp. strangulata TaxID=200361 RepID=A0A453I7Y9_AEGTS
CKDGRLIHLMPFNVPFTVQRDSCVICRYDTRLQWSSTVLVFV